MNKPRVPRTDRATSVWMCVAAVAAAVTIVARGRIPQNLWTMIHISAGTSAHAYPLSMHTAARRGRPLMRTVPRATSCQAVSTMRTPSESPISG